MASDNETNGNNSTKTPSEKDLSDRSIIEQELFMQHAQLDQIGGVKGKVLRWLRDHMNENAILFTLAAIVGVVTGVCAAVFKLAITSLAKLFTSRFNADGFNWFLLVVPIVGLLLTAAYQRYGVHMQLSHGVDKISAKINKRVYRLKKRLMYAWMVAGTLTLGFGGSAGSEGPIASTGAAIGSNLGQMFNMRPNLVRILLGCGAGAGIAAIFKAPVGGFLFTLEVLKLELGTLSVMALMLACLVASLVAYALSGFTVDLSYIQVDQFEPAMIPWILFLGVVCGFYSLYYISVMDTMTRRYSSIKNRWLMSGVCGLVLSAILFAFPAMYGEGYGVMEHVLNGDVDALFRDGPFFRIEASGWWLAAMCAAIVLLKSFACSATNTGGVAGDFAPTLYAGCMLGLLFATVVNTGFDSGIPASAFAFMGMAGVMAGVVRAPFMAIFITAEMCNGFVMLLPLAVVATISFGVTRIFKPASTYTTLWGG